ncbi:MAG: SpoIIE family protein phosphatase, partial [Acidobacteria bacterium]|nr:SpoIIE family protein phosphatase [Acidobacteriota bacterium]
LLVLSVVPLGAVTYFSYTSQVRALRDLATREADMLSSEMTQRMQLVTTELSTRVEQLAQINEPAVVRVAQRTEPEPDPTVVTEPPTVAQPPSVPTTTAAAPPSTTVGAVTQASEQARVAEALGAAAMLLQSVELQGMRGGRPPTGSRGDAPPRVDSGRGDGGRGDTGRGGGRGDTNRRMGPRPPGAAIGPPRPEVLTPTKPAEGPQPPDTAAQTATPPAAPAAPVVPGSSDKVVIDMGAIAREMFSKYVPEGGFEKMTPEQRQQLAREVNSRMMGIAEGIRISSEELKKRADEARQESAAAAVTPTPTPAAPAPRPSTPAPAVRPTTRTSTLVGNRLDVKLMQDGKVVGEVNATIDLENVLATVFSPTRREQGEVPFAIGPDGKVYTANDADQKTVQDLGPIARPDGPLGKTVLPDWIVFTTADPSGSGLRFGIARPVGDSLDDLRRTAGRNAGLGLLLIGIAIVGVVPISGRLTRNLTALTEGVDRIAHGDYRARVPVRSRDEIGELAVAFNKMAEDVERHQTAMVEQERLRRELELGRQIQSDMLPSEPMSFGLTEVQGVSIPAREVGGDFFNYFALDNGQLALLVGDVSGKGVGAALLMANIQASLRTRLAMGQGLDAIAESLDREMATTSGSRLYVTLFLGIFDPATRRLQYVNAGHNPQFVLRPGQPLEKMHATGIPIGLLAGRGYEHRDVALASGDLLFFYTDGCVESENESDEMFGTSRLEALLVSIGSSGPSTPNRVLQQVEEAVTSFRGTREPNDDATMMAVRIG